MGVVNKVNEEGDWSTWSKTLSAQFLSKQPKELIEKQLKLTIADKKDELAEIKTIANPIIKEKFLVDFGDECDKAAADLKAKGFPGQSSHVYYQSLHFRIMKCMPLTMIMGRKYA